MWLVKNGIELDVAAALSPELLEGWVIHFINFERPPDQQFNTKTMQFNIGKK